MKKYDVYMKSVPGMYAQYNGKVTVYADNEEEAVDLALLKLRRGSFPDRSSDMWRIEKIECIGI